MNINSNRVIAGFAAGVCALAILPGSVQAQLPLPPGTALTTLPLNGAPIAGGTLDASLLNQPYTSGDLNGTLSTWVIAGNAANPLGGLTFVYQINNGVPGSVSDLQLQGFSGVTTGVGNNTVGDGALLPLLVGSVGAFSAARSSTPGDVIDFGNTGLALPGKISSYLVVDTSAISFQPSTAELFGGIVQQIGIADTHAADLGPRVPDAGSTVMLLGAALSGIAFLRRKVTA